MRLATAFALLSLLSTHSSAFVGLRNTFFRPSLTSVESTLAPETPDTMINGDDTENKGALSMQIDDLAKILGGRGRAQIVWDCYSIVSQSRGK